MFRFPLLALLMCIVTTVSADDYPRLTNLPTIYINTFDNRPVTSKTDYIYATMHYVDEADQLTTYDSLQIRGRGNSTWGLAKKPFRIKFHSKEKFLGTGYAKAKSWTLLANAGDKSLMRNAVTTLMGEFTSLKFNPAAKFVDLVLNGEFLGNYQISDQVEVRPHRVNITEQDLPLADTSDISGGYLLEVDGFYDANTFVSSEYGVPIRIHYPDEEDIAYSQTEYIRQYISGFERALANDNYTDARMGYRQWVDSASLADWYICTEMSANIDGFWSSYFYKDQGDSLLYWGPLWDYDIAYDNDWRIPGTVDKLMTEDGYGDTRKWTNRMWTDPWFARLINHRYNELLDAGIVKYLHEKIDSLNILLQESQERNYEKWGINRRMYHEIVLYSSYDQYVADLKAFITDHAEWLKTAFLKKSPEEPVAPEEPDDPTPPFVPENYYYRLTNVRTGKAIEMVDGEIVQMTVADDRVTQEWQIMPVGDCFHLVNRSGNVALNDPTEGVVGPTTNVGTQLNVASADDTDFRQLWTLIPQGTEGCYNLLNAYSEHIANLSGGSDADYTPIVSYNNDDRNAVSQNRLWRLEATEKLPESVSVTQLEMEPEEYALTYNPHTQYLHFASAIPDDLHFQAVVYTAGGRKVAAFNATEGYDMSHEAIGTYIVVWKTGGKLRSVKLQK